MGAEAQQSTVYVVDDDPSVRRALRRLLKAAGHLIEEFASAEEFLRRAVPAAAGCVVLDIRMPRMTGTALFDLMVANGWSLPVVFLTAHGDVPNSVHAMKHGAVDFLLKPVDAEALLRAIDEAIQRHATWLAAERSDAALRQRLDRLSPREREVMDHVVRGEPNKRIASELGISEKTVKVHRHRVMQKMAAGSVAELVRLADGATALLRAV